MLHQPHGGVSGQATDMEIHLTEMLKTKDKLNEIYSIHTGRDKGLIRDALERDNFMTAEEAKEFGVIDHVMSHDRTQEGGGE